MPATRTMVASATPVAIAAACTCCLVMPRAYALAATLPEPLKMEPARAKLVWVSAASSGVLEPALAEGARCELGPRGHIMALEEPAQVRLDGSGTDAQTGADLVIRCAVDHRVQYLALSLRKADAVAGADAEVKSAAGGAADGVEQFGGRRGFDDEPGGAEPQGRIGVLGVVVGGDHDHGGHVAGRLVAQQVEPGLFAEPKI